MSRNKPWDKKKGSGRRPRNYPKGKPKDSILIVCEGEKTEPNYFESFHITSLTVEGYGYNTVSLVDKAIELRQEAKQRKEPYDHVWCVFDRDSFPTSQVNTAIQKAKENKIKVAFSNEAFELWYLLHFIYFDTAINREQYIEKLNSYLEFKYEKNNREMYGILLDKQPNAINHAMKLLEIHDGKTPANSNPSTTVYQLVEELNKFL